LVPMTEMLDGGGGRWKWSVGVGRVRCNGRQRAKRRGTTRVAPQTKAAEL
jgi:hypothetical protein